jgi:uncharacterized membrane protein
VGGLGILLAVVGLYTLEYSAADVAPGRFLEPLRSIATNRGAQYMLATAGIWGITATFDKIGVQATTPLVWLLLQHTLITLGAGIYLYWRQRIPRSISSPTATKLALPGIAEALSAALHMYAISIWYVPYVIIIKRTSVLFTVLFGSVFFQEEKLRSRLTGTMVMLIGVALIVLYG